MIAFKAAPIFQQDRCGHMDTMAKRPCFPLEAMSTQDDVPGTL